VLGKCLDKVFGIETDHIVSHHRSAHPGSYERIEKRVDMTAWHDEQVCVVKIKLMVENHNEILGKKRKVCFYNAFRLPCCSAGIHDDPRVIGCYNSCRLFRACFSKRFFIGYKTVNFGVVMAKNHITGYCGDVLFHLCDCFGPWELLTVSLINTPLNDKDLTFAVIDVVFHFSRCESEHQWYTDKPALCCSSVYFHPFNAIVCEYCKPITFFHSHVCKGVCKPARSLIPLLKGIGFVQVFNTNLFGPFEGIYPQHVFCCHPASIPHSCSSSIILSFMMQKPTDATFTRQAPGDDTLSAASCF